MRWFSIDGLLIPPSTLTLVFIGLCELFSAANGMTQVKFHVAPMQAYTNQHLRYFYGTLNPSAWLWTEMEKTQDLLKSHDASARRLIHWNDNNTNKCVLQLGGNNVTELIQCVQRASEYSYDEINLNCGCPSVETGGADYGAALMKDPTLTKHLLSSMHKEAKGIPISVKIRIAAHDSYEEEREESYEHLLDFVKQISDQQTSSMHVVVHARSAILSGFSICKNRSIPPLKHNFVHKLSKDLPHHRISLNGGISSLDQLDLVLNEKDTNINGVMAGRWLLRRPLDLLDIYQYMHHENTNLHSFQANYKKKFKALVNEKVDAILKYGEYAAAKLREGVYSKSDILMPLCLVAFQLQDDVRTMEEGDVYDDAQEEALDILRDALSRGMASAIGDELDMNKRDEITMRSITKTLKRVLGTKVFNKIRRNRNEI